MQRKATIQLWKKEVRRLKFQCLTFSVKLLYFESWIVNSIPFLYHMKKFAVIVAGGAGTRMKNSTPKQFLFLHGQPLLWYTIQAFLQAYDDIHIILVLPAVHIHSEMVQALLNERVTTTAGGETRFHSVRNGVSMIEEESIIFVHDGVRCLVSTELIHRCYNAALEVGSAIPVVPIKESVRLLNEEDSEAIDRNRVVTVQTPQTFHSRILLPAFDIDYKERFTDEATVVETYGLRISLVLGEEHNIKITRPMDLLIAEALLAEVHAG